MTAASRFVHLGGFMYDWPIIPPGNSINARAWSSRPLLLTDQQAHQTRGAGPIVAVRRGAADTRTGRMRSRPDPVARSPVFDYSATPTHILE
jgi:hypothetical protein